MLIKVYRGTRIQEADNLCDSCRHSRIVRGRRMEEELVVCGMLAMHGFQVTFKVTECTEYLDQQTPTYHELFEQAWILRPKTRRRPAGFVRAADLRGEEARRLFAACEDEET